MKFRLAEMCTYEEWAFHHSPAMAVLLLWKVTGSSVFLTCIFSLDLVRSQKLAKRTSTPGIHPFYLFWRGMFFCEEG